MWNLSLLSFDVKTYVLSCENLCAMMLIWLEIQIQINLNVSPICLEFICLFCDVALFYVLLCTLVHKSNPFCEVQLIVTENVVQTGSKVRENDPISKQVFFDLLKITQKDFLSLHYTYIGSIRSLTFFWISIHIIKLFLKKLPLIQSQQ